ncbi:MAG: FIST C-terminal domain-containing protein [Candidatus Krumholzibacteria bacterium]|nr:FIST C-terminal domain-containing protein [Candidatus Krumholzibacteria bacterium]
MKFASAVTHAADPTAAARELGVNLRAALGPARADLALVFASVDYASEAEALAAALEREMGARTLLGCTAEGVITSGREIERERAVSVIAARLPEVELAPFAIVREDLEAIARDAAALAGVVDAPADARAFILLGDPLTAPMDALLGAFNGIFAGVPVIGGMASGARGPGVAALFAGARVYREGAVGVAMAGALAVDTIVSQGCRPVGLVFTITRAHANVIESLEGGSPLECINALVDDLDDDERGLLTGGLFVGRAVDSSKDALGRGDFLVRGVVGVDPESGAIAVGDMVKAGERVQFHVRDAATAREDLEMMLTPHAFFGEPAGALLFSCNGRGTRLYDHPDGDVTAIQEFWSDLAVAGFFCAGEIGPIGGRNFLHGHTASIALIRPRGKQVGAPPE